MYGVDFCAAAAAAIRIFLVSYLCSGTAAWVLSGGENRVGMHLCMGNRCSCIRRNLQLPFFFLSRKLGVCGGGLVFMAGSIFQVLRFNSVFFAVPLFEWI